MDSFSLPEVLRLLGAAKQAKERDWLLLAVTFLYALRSSEAVGLTRDNVVGEYLSLKRGKGSKPVRFPLVSHENPLLNVRDPLIAFSRKANGKQRLFPISPRTFQRLIHKYGAIAGLPEIACHPHTLKHSILSHLIESMSTSEVQLISGHKSLDSLQVYLHPRAEKVQEKFRKALDG